MWKFMSFALLAQVISTAILPILVQELDEYAGAGNQGMLSKARDIPAPLDRKLLHIENNQGVILHFAFHCQGCEHAHSQPGRHGPFDGFDMPKHHANFEWYAGDLEHFFYCSSCS